MPTKRAHDKTGWFFRWGLHGHKYRFNPMSSFSIAQAKARADRQGRAIKAHGGKIELRLQDRDRENVGQRVRRQQEEYRQGLRRAIARLKVRIDEVNNRDRATTADVNEWYRLLQYLDELQRMLQQS